MSHRATTVAELIVECLENEGVTHVFGIPGEENIHLVEALSRSSIRYVLVRHEQGASFMAETYGRLTGKAGSVFRHARPRSHQPADRRGRRHHQLHALVALSAQVGMKRSFKESHQGVDWSHVRPGDQVVSAGGHPRGARNGPKGFQTGADRAPRSGLSGGARRH